MPLGQAFDEHDQFIRQAFVGYAQLGKLVKVVFKPHCIASAIPVLKIDSQ